MTSWRNYDPFIKKNKYKNTKVEVDGITFDSQKEARRYKELLMLEKAGEIKNLQRQVEYELIPTQREPDTVGPRGGIKRGKILEKKCSYMADFVYEDVKTGKTVVEDTKGFRTKDYIIKRKLLLFRFGLRITEI